MSVDTTDHTPALAHDVAELVTRAQAFTLATSDDYQRAATCLLGIKALRKKIADTFDPHIARAYQAHAALCAEKRSAEKLAAEAETRLKALIVEYDDACRRRDDDARRLASASDDDARAAAQRAADDADARGDFQTADVYRQSVDERAPALVPSSTPRVEGVSLTETWTARVVDLAALVTAAATTPHYLAFLKPDMPALHAQARSLRARMQIPGVRACSTRAVSARSGIGSGRGPQRED